MQTKQLCPWGNFCAITLSHFAHRQLFVSILSLVSSPLRKLAIDLEFVCGKLNARVLISNVYHFVGEGMEKWSNEMSQLEAEDLLYMRDTAHLLGNPIPMCYFNLQLN